MTSALADARQALTAALAPVLPGRVSPYPQTERYVAPYIWIAPAGLTRRSTGRGAVTVAVLAVWCVYDGADRAMVAGADDLVAKAWDAASTVTRANPVLARPDTVEVGGAKLLATVITVEITLSAVTLCPPVVEESPIPPQPLEVML